MTRTATIIDGYEVPGLVASIDPPYIDGAGRHVTAVAVVPGGFGNDPSHDGALVLPLPDLDAPIRVDYSRNPLPGSMYDCPADLAEALALFLAFTSGHGQVVRCPVCEEDHDVAGLAVAHEPATMAARLDCGHTLEGVST